MPKKPNQDGWNQPKVSSVNDNFMIALGQRWKNSCWFLSVAVRVCLEGVVSLFCSGSIIGLIVSGNLVNFETAIHVVDPEARSDACSTR
jgi:hypothetical protein